MRPMGVFTSYGLLNSSVSPDPLWAMNTASGGGMVTIIRARMAIPQNTGILDEICQVSLFREYGSFSAGTSLPIEEIQGERDIAPTGFASSVGNTTSGLAQPIYHGAWHMLKPWLYHPHPDERWRAFEVGTTGKLICQITYPVAPQDIHFSVTWAEWF